MEQAEIERLTLQRLENHLPDDAPASVLLELLRDGATNVEADERYPRWKAAATAPKRKPKRALFDGAPMGRNAGPQDYEALDSEMVADGVSKTLARRIISKRYPELRKSFIEDCPRGPAPAPPQALILLSWLAPHSAWVLGYLDQVPPDREHQPVQGAIATSSTNLPAEPKYSPV